MAIVPRELFERVAAKLAQASVVRRGGLTSVAGATLAGKLFDAAGELMSPAHARGRSGRAYRYYVSASLQRGESRKSILQRVPAPVIEAMVSRLLERLLSQGAADRLKAVHLQAGALLLTLSGIAPRALNATLQDHEHAVAEGRDCIVTVPVALPLRGGARRIAEGRRDGAAPDPTLITALRKARAMLKLDARGLPILSEAPKSPYERRLLRLSLLAPDIQRAILTGRQPRSLNLERLIHNDLPSSWSAQREALGFAPAA